MNTKILLSTVSISTGSSAYENQVSYIIGGIIAILIFGYLVYTLLHPEKF